MLVLLKAAKVLNTTLKSEFELAQHNESLRLELEEKTASLVSQAQNASLGEMAGSIAHEINNPMATLMTNIDLLNIRLEQKQYAREHMDTIIEKMSTNIMRVTKIIKGLRHFSRNTSGDPFAEEKIHALVEQTVALCQEKLEAEGIHLEIKPMPRQ